MQYRTRDGTEESFPVSSRFKTGHIKAGNMAYEFMKPYSHYSITLQEFEHPHQDRLLIGKNLWWGFTSAAEKKKFDLDYERWLLLPRAPKVKRKPRSSSTKKRKTLQ